VAAARTLLADPRPSRCPPIARPCCRWRWANAWSTRPATAAAASSTGWSAGRPHCGATRSSTRSTLTARPRRSPGGRPRRQRAARAGARAAALAAFCSSPTCARQVLSGELAPPTRPSPVPARRRCVATGSQRVAGRRLRRPVIELLRRGAELTAAGSRNDPNQASARLDGVLAVDRGSWGGCCRLELCAAATPDFRGALAAGAGWSAPAV